MNTKILILVVLIFLNIWNISTQQQFVYTVHYVKSFRQDLVQKYIGCKQKSIAYGTYIYPQGPMDALFIFMNPGSYQTRFNSQTKNLYFKLFGTEQNYDQLIQSDPINVAMQIIRNKNGNDWKFIIDWKCPLKSNTQNARVWLNKFTQKLQDQRGDVYVKAPASYFCYTNSGLKYLLDLDKPIKFIVQMYGQQAGVYTSYEQIFEKQVSKPAKDAEYYSESCPKFPSYQTLAKNFANKSFFIQKTLLKQNSGYIGPKFSQYLEKASSIYGKIAFLDSFPQQIIQL